ncbi:MAG: RNA polymerase sigma factor [Kiloniellales bacterium]
MDVGAQELELEDLYLRHHADLRRFLARRLRCEERAADVAQEAFLRLLRFAPGRTMDNARAYLFQVAANAARDSLARERTRDDLVDDGASPEAVPSSDPDLETAASARERLHLVAKAVEELPPRCREVFLMSRLDGLRHSEIAERLGISRNMVEKHVIKAMLHCRRRLNAGCE